MHMQMEYVQELPTPEELKRRFPVSSAIEAIKEKRDEEIAAIFEGKDPRFILIIGPCSADRGKGQGQDSDDPAPLYQQAAHQGHRL